MNQETPTPRTEDAKQYDVVSGQWTVTTDFARQLERELSVTNSEKELYKAAYIRASKACDFIQNEAEELGLRVWQETTSDGVIALKAQRDKLRSELQRLRSALNGPPSYMSCDQDVAQQVSMSLERMQTIRKRQEILNKPL